MARIGYYLTLFKVMVQVSLARLTIFRLHFFLFFLWLSIEIIIDIAFFWIIYGSTKGLPGWEFKELIFFVLISGLYYDLFYSFCGSGPMAFMENFSKGELDFVLIKPVNRLFFLTFKEINFSNFSFARVAGLFLLLPTMELSVTLWQLALAGLSIGLAMFAVHSLMVLIMSSLFWTTEGSAAMEIYWRSSEAINYPKDVFPVTFQKVVTFMVPVVLAGYVPARILLGDLDYTTFLGALVGVLVIYATSRLFWNLGLKRYSSASS